VRVATVVVAFVLVLSGCSAFTGGSDSTTTPTLTPADAPDTAAYPPGVNERGVVSPEALADAHGARDDDRSYTLVSNRTVRFANGTVRSAFRLRIALAENRSYLATISTNGSRGPVLLGRPPASAAYWSDGETYARRLTREGTTTYNTFTPPDQYTGTWRFWARTVAFGGRSGYAGQTIRRTFRAVPTTLVGQERVDDTTLYRLRGDEATSTDFAAPEIDAVSNLSFAATVDRDGLVRRIHYRYDGRIDGVRVGVERTIAYRNVGNTTVGKPAWLPRALNAAQ
jgi:hypothetical protein